MNASREGDFRSGFVAIVGRPNVGKSTLLNRILGQKIAITSDKPQTTRNRILGIHNLPDAQILFLDTPGIHRAKDRLNRFMVDQALAACNEVDAVLFLVEATDPPGGGDQYVLDLLARQSEEDYLADVANRLRARTPLTIRKALLGGNEHGVPMYAPVVLDEAFDKADNEFTALAMNIFENFGFQMIVATPLKSVMTLEPFIGGACFIDISDRRVSGVLMIEYDSKQQRLKLPAQARQEANLEVS